MFDQMINFFFPLFELVDGWLGILFPGIIQIGCWGVFCGIAVPLTYRWLSNQDEIARLKRTSREIRGKLFSQDLSFAEYNALAMRNLRISFNLLRNVGIPGMAAASFTIITIAWLSAYYHYKAPEPGEIIDVRIHPSTKNVSIAPPGNWIIDNNGIHLPITRNAFPLRIQHEGRIIFKGDPTSPPTAGIHPPRWWRMILKSEVGYINDPSIQEIHFGFARKRISDHLPLWMATWEFPFFLCFFIMAIVMMRVFRIQ